MEAAGEESDSSDSVGSTDSDEEGVGAEDSDKVGDKKKVGKKGDKK